MDDEYRFQVLKDIIKKQNKLLIAYNKDSIVYYEMYKLSHERERVLLDNNIKLMHQLDHILQHYHTENGYDNVIIRYDEWRRRALKAESRERVIQGQLNADRKRLIEASKKVDMGFMGGDTPDWLADRILDLEEKERVLREALKSIMETFYNKWDRQDCIDEWNTTAIKMSQVAEKALEDSK